jgi:hypothetical protein
MMNQPPGQPHGRQSPFRWDASTAASMFALGALVFLIFINFSFGASAHIGAGRR